MGEKMKRFIREQAQREADQIMQQVNSDPAMADVHAPDDLEALILAKIDEREEEKLYEKLSDEDREYLELGKRYKKRKKWNVVAATFLIVIFAGSFGVTAMGGAEKVLERVSWMLAGREQTNVDTDDERIEDAEGVTEEEATKQVEEVYDFTPVKMDYIPEGMEFLEGKIYEEIQSIIWSYQDRDGNVLYYTMHPNYRIQSLGNDVEEEVLEEFVKKVGETSVSIKHYKDTAVNKRWKVEFEYKNVYYYIQMHNMSQETIEKVVENLFFP